MCAFVIFLLCELVVSLLCLHATCTMFLLIRSFYFRIFSASLLITFLSPDTAISNNMYVPFAPSKATYCWGWSCQFAHVDSIIWLLYLQNLFLLILVHAHTSVHCLILHPFPWICKSLVQNTHYHVPLCIVLLPILGMLICVLLSHQIVNII